MSLKKKIKNIRYFIEFMVVLFFFKFVKIVPRSIINVIASIAGNAMYLVPSIRKLTVANIKTSFPEKSIKECKQISRKSLIHLIRSLLDFFKFNQNEKHLINDCVYSKKSRELYDSVYDKDKGLVIIAPHYGSWEIAGLIMKHAGHPFAVVAKTIRNPYINKLVNGGRSAFDSKVIPAKGAVKGMIKALKEGSMVATLIDQNTRVRDGGVFVNFFGMPVPASRAPALFGRKFNVPLVVSGSFYNSDGKYEMFIEKVSKETSEYKSDVELIQDIMDVTEKIIREHPEQYLWFYKRFQNIPIDANEETIKKFPYYATVTSERFYDKNAKKNS